MAAAQMVVKSVYVTAWAKMRPVSFLAPSADKVVMTAKAIVGTAMNWNKRVKTVAMKSNNWFSAGMPSQPKMAPMIKAPIHKAN